VLPIRFPALPVMNYSYPFLYKFQTAKIHLFSITKAFFYFFIENARVPYKFALSFQGCTPLTTHCAALLLTGRRLGAGGASTTFVADDKRSITHKIFCGVTAPLAPNRLLAAVHFFLVVKTAHSFFSFFS
jgi:hypothetical protein